MSAQIVGSVGAAGRNRRSDVETVQRLLAQRGLNPGPIDGLCGPGTMRAILNFQAGFLSVPDGRVDPSGTSWRHLTNVAAPSSTGQPAQPIGVPGGTPALAPNPIQGLLARVPKPLRASINQGLTAVSPQFMVQQLGQPRDTYTADCQPMTNRNLHRHVVTESVGRFNVTGLRPAVENLRAALAQVLLEQPAVYALLGTAGMLCCRFVRGSTTAISNHSWGTAIDFTLNGVLDRRGDNQVQVGLTLIASIMNEHGWYWGAAFRTEDAMHFEASRRLISEWAPQLS